MFDLHRISHRNMATGAYHTRCGLSGSIDYSSRRPTNAVYMLSGTIPIADGEGATTCKKCMLKLTPTQKKILQILHDNLILEIYKSHCFRWNSKTKRIAAKNKDILYLMRLGLINGPKITSKGISLATLLSKGKYT